MKEKTYQTINGRLVEDVTIWRRYPRLFSAMQDAACLSYGEAHAAIRVWREVKDNYSSEAVNHFGGFQEVVKAARALHSRQVKNRKLSLISEGEI